MEREKAMKTKLFALIMAILCFVTAFAACEKKCEEHVDEDKDAVCDNCGEAVEVESGAEKDPEDVCNHTDADANKVCDNCGKAIVSIVEQLPAETDPVVDMIVNQIPADADLGQYIMTTYPELDKITDYEKLEGIAATNYVYALVKEDIGGVTIQTLKNILDGTELVTKTDVISERRTVKYTITLENVFYVVTELEMTADPNYVETNEEDEVIPLVFAKQTNTMYTYSGAKIGETHVYDGQNLLDLFVTPGYEEKGGEIYVTYEDMVYVISAETNAIIYSCKPEVLVKRPEMDYIVGNYGYVINDDSVNVYDLTEWIKCVYTYDVPEEADESDIYVLNGGDLLVVYEKRLSGKSVNYDFIIGEDKYDIVYTVIDGKTFEEKNVEFGYLIMDAFSLEDAEGGYATEKAREYNYLYAYEIVEGRVSDKSRSFIVDNELNIMCDMTDMEFAYPVADGIFCRRVTFNDNTAAYELVSIKGEHIGYLPIDSDFISGYRLYENKIYDVSSGELVLDLDECVVYDGLNSYYNNGYMLIAETVEEKVEVDGVETVVTKTVYSIFNGKGKTKLDSSKDNWQIHYANDLGYLVSYTEEVEVQTETLPGEEPKTEIEIVTVYEFYNVAGELVIESDSFIRNYSFGYEDGVYTVYDMNGNMYVLR